MTFTSPRTMSEAQLGAPAPAYLQMLIAGLRESWAMSDDALTAYLGSTLGCSVELVDSVLAGFSEREG